ncbi:hypothetical protein [Histidinibacterium lentulum]|uniref:Pilus assembly protein PilP n=1 Tax=Histidinibacterium lentulum TaxID=2480588 RepID=A0A3N2QLS7_9RHOB|nr:hypothetical protein [Histidinibacterium lentulum]ROT96124.1 hypothetical protein EAT49_19275 [Histidinibacterium lentulum]
MHFESFPPSGAPTSETEAAATESGLLPDRGPALLGIVEGPEGARALIRHDGGEVTMATTGDDTPSGRIAAVGQGQVVLSGGVWDTVLTMPAG